MPVVHRFAILSTTVKHSKTNNNETSNSSIFDGAVQKKTVQKLTHFFIVNYFFLNLFKFLTIFKGRNKVFTFDRLTDSIAILQMISVVLLSLINSLTISCFCCQSISATGVIFTTTFVCFPSPAPYQTSVQLSFGSATTPITGAGMNANNTKKRARKVISAGGGNLRSLCSPFIRSMNSVWKNDGELQNRKRRSMERHTE